MQGEVYIISPELAYILCLVSIYYLFIWLHRVLFASWGIFRSIAQTFYLWHIGSVFGAHRLGYFTACGILVPQPGIEPTVACIARQILNNWTTREVPYILFFYIFIPLLSYKS